MRIGILGGTFDPPHMGHLALAKAAIEQLKLEEVLFLPANRNPDKESKTRTSAEDRLEMVRQLVANEEGLAYSDMEITRGGNSYTVDTLAELQMAQPAEYWLIMGADALRGVPSWKAPQRLLKMCRIGVVVRPPIMEPDIWMHTPEDIRAKVDLFQMETMDISSSEIRERLSRKQPINPWMPDSIVKYIREHKLYQG